MRTAALGLAFAMLVAAGVPLAATQPASRSIDGFASYDDVKGVLESIASLSPDIATLETIGTTFEGRDILALRLCAGEGPAALIMGGHHAREPASAEIALDVARTLAYGYGHSTPNGTITWLLENREVWIVPMVNPDGIEYVLESGNTEWRKNRRPVDIDGDGAPEGVGVDLNRNYGHLWGDGNSDHDPTSQQYCGPSAFSEPETRAVRMLAERERFSTSVSFHSYGEVVYYPWNNDVDVESNGTLAAFASEVAERCGYVPMEGYRAYATFGDSDDWLYANMSVAPVTIELGTEFFPSYDARDDMRPGAVAAALYACEMAGRAADASLPDWTLAVYMAADNNLADKALLDLNEMEAAPGSADVDVVVLHDGAGHGDSRIVHVEPDSHTATATSPAIDDGGAVVNAATKEVAMNDPETLARFLNWTSSAYPSQRLGVVLWNHGNDVLGGLCVDAGVWLGTAEACAVLRSAAEHRPLDLVGLDLCWGASLEMAAELTGSARTFVASELEEPDTGWEYAGVVGWLAANPNAGPDELGKKVVASYSTHYALVGYGSMSAFSLPILRTALDWWDTLSGNMQAYAYYNQSAFLDARDATGSVWSSKPNLVDVTALCQNLSLSTEVVDLVRGNAWRFGDELGKARLSSFSGFSAKGATGLYVYHPALGGYAAGYAEFAASGGWREYLAELKNPTQRAMVSAGAEPSALNTTGPYLFEAWLTEPDGANVTLRHTANGSEVAVPMSHVGGGRFTAQVPGQEDGATITYYFESVDAAGFHTRFPMDSNEYLYVTVRALLDLFVEGVNISEKARVGEACAFSLTVGNAGMEPSWAEVRLHSPDGLLVNSTVFLGNGALETFDGAWTPSSPGNSTLVASVVAINKTMPDAALFNNSAKANVTVLPAAGLDGIMFVVVVASVGACSFVAAAYTVRMDRARRRDAVEKMLLHAEGLVADLESGGCLLPGPRAELSAARGYLREGKLEWAEKAAQRAESQAIAALRDSPDAPHG
jgi:carboxypeptidase T